MQYVLFVCCRKPNLPIEMEFAKEKQDVADSDAQSCNWDPDQIFQHATMMSKVEEVIYTKAKQNIDAAQKERQGVL